MRPVTRPDAAALAPLRLWRADLDRPPLPPDALDRTLTLQEADWDARRRACRGLLRVLLGRALGLPPAAVPLAYGPWGKPLVVGGALTFSVSHCGGLALFALSCGREVGVDLERVGPDAPPPSLAEQCLTRADAAALACLAPDERAAAFCRAWVRREAYLKAAGVGFAAPPPDPGAEHWLGYDLDVGDGLCAAACVSSPISLPVSSPISARMAASGPSAAPSVSAWASAKPPVW